MYGDGCIFHRHLLYEKPIYKEEKQMANKALNRNNRQISVGYKYNKRKGEYSSIQVKDDTHFYVYMCLYAGVVIYVGRTSRKLFKRLEEHRTNPKFLEFFEKNGIRFEDLTFKACKMATYEDEKRAEHNAIAKYQPELNIISRRHYDGGAVDDFDWRPAYEYA